jgi:hypothetical protein
MLFVIVIVYYCVYINTLSSVGNGSKGEVARSTR